MYLHHISPQFSRHYVQGFFLPDILSSLPLVAISQLMFQETKVAKVEGFPLIFFHSAFVVDMLRMTSMRRCWRYFHDLADVSLYFLDLLDI